MGANSKLRTCSDQTNKPAFCKNKAGYIQNMLSLRKAGLAADPPIGFWNFFSKTVTLSRFVALSGSLILRVTASPLLQIRCHTAEAAACTMSRREKCAGRSVLLFGSPCLPRLSKQKVALADLHIACHRRERSALLLLLVTRRRLYIPPWSGDHDAADCAGLERQADHR